MVHTVYDEVANFMATMNPEKVIAFKPSEANQKCFDLLLDKQKQNELSVEEKSELEHYLMLNRIIGLAKAQALNLV
jgi:Holliday junction resolvase